MEILVESNYREVETVSEESNGSKNWYINGVFAQANVINGNKRIYPAEVLDKSMTFYDKNFVQKNRAVGELTHPKTTQINPDKISHLIESIQKDGNNYIGKAKILNTPTGKIVTGLLEGGVQLGVSTRADGVVKRNSQGINEVQDGLRMAAVDVVFQPSAPDAFVEAVMEGAEFVWDTMSEDQEFVQKIKEEISSKTSRQLQEEKAAIMMRFFNALKG